MTRERRKTIALWLGWSLATLFAMAAHLRYVEGITGAIFSNSEPEGLYREVSGEPARGGLVELRDLIKHVAAIPGDTVRVSPEGSYIDGKLWPFSAPASPNYKPFAFGTYKLAPGQYWLLGDHPFSFDSRYIGMIPLDLINRPVKPLWTKSNGYTTGTRPW
jgi:type IV secretory pathway protease TraF